MEKTDNAGQFILDRRTGKVALPEAGEGAYLQFDMKAFSELETAYGDDYIDILVKGLAKMKIPLYQKAVACTLKDCNNGELPYGMQWEELNIRLLDALNLAIYGRTYEEQQKFSEDKMAKRLAEFEENPKVAAILSMLSASSQEQKPD